MIQRIQSIYLILAAAALAFFLGAPLATYTDLNDAVHHVSPNPMELKYWLAVLSILVAVIDIFYYSNRRIQINICYTNCLLIIILASIVTYELFMIDAEGVKNFQIQFGTFLPTIALIFHLLAAKSISKDIQTVKSSDRLR